ncbi:MULTISPECIES: NUDIX hydrolase [unclassified Nitratiruptor]|uniref:NUDIX domain-containing protein n=1 Tax=unclassified Nitratiruptor TaxID=2624044 RepID=UPI001916BB86|nr:MULTISPECIES: NUDIX hydrolase [unclassified Nitratiruptor]BCD60599.1 8-oxo-dGTP diphosphatase [Nitratiruptor sp. YY08-10]BCD64530.1 8-oxo-dGTP diphosphatase [Nitratiruptor sp. YY08-14]
MSLENFSNVKYSYPFQPKTPYVAVDGIIKIFIKEQFQGIVLIERKNEPKGFALPGGFVEIGEKVEDALRREMKEETGLDVESPRLFHVFSDPLRDPRFHTVSITFECIAYKEPKSGDDAKAAHIVKLEEIPWDRLVFDHADILQKFLKRE